MKSDVQNSKNELIEELITLRQQAAEADDLQKRLADLEKSYANLQKNYGVYTKDFKEECNCRDNTEEALRMAEVILDRSPAVLFRRKADDKPTLVYVSNNIKQLGYSADDFSSGRIHPSDIVHPDDVKRVGAEIREYAEKTMNSIYLPGDRDPRTTSPLKIETIRHRPYSIYKGWTKGIKNKKI